MELIDIIIYVLKLFALSSFILLTLSYMIFKIKDRSRIKPYMVLSTNNSVNASTRHYKIIPHEEKPEADKNNPPVKKLRSTRRYKVINEQTTYRIESESKEDKTPIPEPAPVRQQRSTPRKMDVYSFYSTSKFESMHKLKLQ